MNRIALPHCLRQASTSLTPEATWRHGISHLLYTWVNAEAHLDPCSRFSFTTTSFAMSLHAGIAASLTAEHVLFKIMLPMGLVIALASLMP